MSKVNVRVLNDLTESKKRVMTNVVQHLEQREMKKRSWRWPYSVMSIIVTICIGIFLYTQGSGNQDQKASIPEPSISTPIVLDENYLKFILKLNPRVEWSNDVRKQKFDFFLEEESLYAYAQLKGIVPTQQKIDKYLDIFIEGSEKQNQVVFANKLQKLNVTKEEYFEQYINPISYKVATTDSLWEHEKNQAKDVNKSIQYFLLKREALNYLEEHYGQEIEALRKKYEIPVVEKEIYSKRGVVVAIKEHEFLVVSNASKSNIGKLSIDEIVQNHGNGTWFPLIDSPTTLSLGDYVEVNYSEELEKNDDAIIKIADIDSMKILEGHS